MKLANTSDLSSDDASLVGSTPISPTSADILKLYPEYHTVYGPYVRPDKRKIIILYDGTKRSARQYAKILLELKLGRRLVNDETVDHIDRDFTNDAPDNLRVLSRSDNSSLAGYRPDMFADCATCGSTFVLSKDQRSKRSLAKRKFCSKRCIQHI